MTLGEFLEVYDSGVPFWVNYPDATGWYDGEFFNGKDEYYNDVCRMALRGEEKLYWDFDEVENITVDGDGVVTVELKYIEEV